MMVDSSMERFLEVFITDRYDNLFRTIEERKRRRSQDRWQRIFGRELDNSCDSLQ